MYGHKHRYAILTVRYIVSLLFVCAVSSTDHKFYSSTAFTFSWLHHPTSITLTKSRLHNNQYYNYHYPAIVQSTNLMSKLFQTSNEELTIAPSTHAVIGHDNVQQLHRPELVISVKQHLVNSDDDTHVNNVKYDDNNGKNNESTKNPTDRKVQLILASQSPRRKEIFDMMGLQSLYRIVVPTSAYLNETLLQNKLRGSATQQGLDPIRYTRTLAEQKAYAVAYEMLTSTTNDVTIHTLPVLVLGSDTIVVVSDEKNGTITSKILEKPKDTSDAIEMLTQLQNTSHTVYTGVAIVRILPIDYYNDNNDNSSIPATSSISHDGYYIDGIVRMNELNDANEQQQQQHRAYHTLLVQSFVESATVYFASLTDVDIRNYVATNEPMDKAGGYGIQGIGGQIVSKIHGDYFTVMGLPMHRTSRALASSIQEIVQNYI